MKTLLNPVISVAEGKITIVADIQDVPFNGLLTTRVSHMHINPDNMEHHRRIQSSSECVFCEFNGGKLAIPNEVIAKIAAYAAPESSFTPKFKRGSTPKGVVIASETPVSIQWQISDDAFPMATKPDTLPPEAIWNDIPGATSEKLDDSFVKSGQWVRCVATNLAGKTITKAVKK